MELKAKSAAFLRIICILNLNDSISVKFEQTMKKYTTVYYRIIMFHSLYFKYIYIFYNLHAYYIIL